MKKIIITGGSGLVGSQVSKLLSDKYEFQKISRETGVNITKKDDTLSAFKSSNAEIVIHMAAKADVDGCEKDKISDQSNLEQKSFNWDGSETAYGVNVYGTSNVVSAASQTNKKLIYISTDFVFDGEKDSPYLEEDLPNPINWYAKTKFIGEEEAKKASEVIIARIAYPYRADFEKKDFARAMISRFESKEGLNAVTDHVMTPTFVDDIAFSLDKLIENWNSGIYHVVGSSFVSPFEAALKIADTFGFDKNLIKEATRAQFFDGRASRPFHLALKNDKIAKLGVKMRTFDEGLLELKNT